MTSSMHCLSSLSEIRHSTIGFVHSTIECVHSTVECVQVMSSTDIVVPYDTYTDKDPDALVTSVGTDPRVTSC